MSSPFARKFFLAPGANIPAYYSFSTFTFGTYRISPRTPVVDFFFKSVGETFVFPNFKNQSNHPLITDNQNRILRAKVNSSFRKNLSDYPLKCLGRVFSRPPLGRRAIPIPPPARREWQATATPCPPASICGNFSVHNLFEKSYLNTIQI